MFGGRRRYRSNSALSIDRLKSHCLRLFGETVEETVDSDELFGLEFLSSQSSGEAFSLQHIGSNGPADEEEVRIQLNQLDLHFRVMGWPPAFVSAVYPLMQFHLTRGGLPRGLLGFYFVLFLLCWSLPPQNLLPRHYVPLLSSVLLPPHCYAQHIQVGTMDGKDLNDPLNNVALIKDDQTRTNLVSSGDTDKMIQRLTDDLHEAQEMANSEKHKNMELQASLEKEKKEKKQQSDDSAKQIQVLQGQLEKLHGEMSSLREQLKGSSGAQDEVHKAKEEVKSLKKALDEAKAEGAAVSKDLDRWHQTATKYEKEVENLQNDLQQQSKQWQKTAEIQASELQSVQLECNGLQKECASLRSEKQETQTKHQKEKAALQSECAALKAEKDALIQSHLKEKSGLQSNCSSLRSEAEAAVQKLQQLERNLDSSRAKNAELTNSLKNLEKSQKDLEAKLSSLELQHQEERQQLQTNLDDANARNDTLQKECDDALAEVSNIKVKYEKTEQQNQLLTEELHQCKESVKEIQEKGTTKLWMIWGPVAAVAATAVTAAVLLRT
uniref:Sarcolemma associated protein b n=1 Tax=Knipowitschia caucasica TaxID=637954 RepID=A0AAV2LX24_KNICA